MTVSKRGFLSGLGALFAAPAIIPYGNLMPIKIMLPSPEVILQKTPGWFDARLLWRASPGEELICSSGRKVIGLVRHSMSRVATLGDREPLEWSVERHADGTLFFKNIDEVRYLYERDGYTSYNVETIDPRYPTGVGHLKNIAWSYDKELQVLRRRLWP